MHMTMGFPLHNKNLEYVLGLEYFKIVKQYLPERFSRIFREDVFVHVKVTGVLYTS